MVVNPFFGDPFTKCELQNYTCSYVIGNTVEKTGHIHKAHWNIVYRKAKFVTDQCFKNFRYRKIWEIKKGLDFAVQ